MKFTDTKVDKWFLAEILLSVIYLTVDPLNFLLAFFGWILSSLVMDGIIFKNLSDWS